jgi:hypothetical protein
MTTTRNMTTTKTYRNLTVGDIIVLTDKDTGAKIMCTKVYPQAAVFVDDNNDTYLLRKHHRTNMEGFEFS